MRALAWIASSLDDLRELPDDVQDSFGYALYLAQAGKSTPARSRSRVSKALAFWRLSRAMTGRRIARFTRFGWPAPSMSCTSSRRNRNAGLRHLRPTSISSGNV